MSFYRLYVENCCHLVFYIIQGLFLGKCFPICLQIISHFPTFCHIFTNFSITNFGQFTKLEKNSESLIGFVISAMENMCQTCWELPILFRTVSNFVYSCLKCAAMTMTNHYLSNCGNVALFFFRICVNTELPELRG